jgi:hypothetical protein
MSTDGKLLEKISFRECSFFDKIDCVKPAFLSNDNRICEKMWSVPVSGTDSSSSSKSSIKERVKKHRSESKSKTKYVSRSRSRSRSRRKNKK